MLSKIGKKGSKSIFLKQIMPATTLGAVQNLKTSAITATSVKLTWSKPTKEASSVTGYIVLVKMGSVTKKTINLGKLVLTTNVTSLLPETSYSFVVQAFSKSKKGITTTITARTPAVSKVAPLPPTGLVFVSRTVNTVSLSWTPPTITGTSALSFYRVSQYLEDEDPDITVDKRSSGTSNRIVFERLLPSTTYVFNVYAINNDKLESIPSASLSVTTLEDSVDPLPPTGLSAIPRYSDVTLNWIAPAKNGSADILEYTVCVKNNEEVVIQSYDVRSRFNTLNVEDLEPGTAYSFSIISKTTTGNQSLSSQSLEVTTLKNTTSKPPSPINCQAVAQNNEVINLTWQNLISESRITGYEIKYNITSNLSTEPLIKTIQDAKSTSTIIDELQSNTEYTFTVTTVSDSPEPFNKSDPSVTFRATTAPNEVTPNAIAMTRLDITRSYNTPELFGKFAVIAVVRGQQRDDQPFGVSNNLIYNVECYSLAFPGLLLDSKDITQTNPRYDIIGYGVTFDNLIPNTGYVFKFKIKGSTKNSPTTDVTYSLSGFSPQPRQPANLSASVSGNRVSLAWGYVENAYLGEIEKYIVKISKFNKITGELDVVYQSNVNKTSQSLNNIELESGKTYLARVNVVYNNGYYTSYGVYSDPRIFTTDTTTPKAVTDLQTLAVNDTSLILTWENSDSSEDQIVSYLVRYREPSIESDANDTIIYSGLIKRAFISGLTPDTLYSFRVYGISINGVAGLITNLLVTTQASS
jgi:hypothetical protein